ncbi:hypothetical protein FH972_014565 [Carpinus fangiana]|uniref:Uncharacterized protein n=1 Tax=Carpinus fangiana TaxID=176857 RepID=A0A5N6RAD5_9ROSI|nr:hypothetical protein FH972_014565 [Carpinus fangiana]
MGGGEDRWEVVPPVVAPLNGEREEWRHFYNSVNAVSFGLVATAILISMFLVMAIFERFQRTTSAPSGERPRSDLEGQMGFNRKLDYPSPKMTVYAKGVSVLMPGEEIPTFIAHLAPTPSCPPEHISLHQQNPSFNPSQGSLPS